LLSRKSLLSTPGKKRLYYGGEKKKEEWSYRKKKTPHPVPWKGKGAPNLQAEAEKKKDQHMFR